MSCIELYIYIYVFYISSNQNNDIKKCTFILKEEKSI